MTDQGRDFLSELQRGMYPDHYVSFIWQQRYPDPKARPKWPWPLERLENNVVKLEKKTR